MLNFILVIPDMGILICWLFLSYFANIICHVWCKVSCLFCFSGLYVWLSNHSSTRIVYDGIQRSCCKSCLCFCYIFEKKPTTFFPLPIWLVLLAVIMNFKLQILRYFLLIKLILSWVVILYWLVSLATKKLIKKPPFLC